MPTPPPAGPPRRRPTRRGLGLWLVGLGLAGVAAAAPALAEARVHSELRARFGVGPDFAVDLDLRGLELRNVARELPDGRGRVVVDHLRIRPATDGIHVEIEGLTLELSRRRAKAKPSSAGQGPSRPAPERSRPRAKPEPKPDPITTVLRRLRGVPIHVATTRSTVRVELSEGLIASALDPSIELPGDGRITVEGEFEVGDGGPAWAHASLSIATHDENPRELQIEGRLDIEVDRPGTRLDAKGLRIAGQVSPQRAVLALREPGGGEAELSVDRRAESGPGSGTLERVDLRAHDLPLDLLAPIASRITDKFGDKVEFDFSSARMDGHIALTRGPKRIQADFEAVEVRGLGLDSRFLAAQPVGFDILNVDGSVARTRSAGPRGSTTEAALVFGHGALQFQADATIDALGLSFDFELAETDCQNLIDSLPEGASPQLAGSALSGDIHAAFGLSLTFADLATARARYLVDGQLELPDDDFEAPGRLHFDFPFLESCTVERLGPGVDIEGLEGSYHHDFVTGAGRDRRRVLAVGDPGYVSIDDIPKLALAFVITEDARFWDHDGFDRTQIERAFWFNLLEGRVRRGASTISQQTARSLWLGIDRSMTRKLAEALLAAELERSVDKRRILEVYLNVIELGPEIHGVVEAAEYHFGKHPSALDLREALHLASLAPAPVGYSRRFASGHTDRAWRDRLRAQIRRLRIRHLISRDEARRATAKRLDLRPHPELSADRPDRPRG